MKYFEFDQNNSGGRHIKDPARGIGPNVWILAKDAEDAANKARAIGIYFDGVASGYDCGCCGDRWHYPSGPGQDAPEVNQYSFSDHPVVYVHEEGTIREIKKHIED
jgi:hypothetical protein